MIVNKKLPVWIDNQLNGKSIVDNYRAAREEIQANREPLQPKIEEDLQELIEQTLENLLKDLYN